MTEQLANVKNRSIDKGLVYPVSMSEAPRNELTGELKEPYEMEQWENPEWEYQTCMVLGTGRYRFNQYGTDGFAWRQFRFKTKDEAMDYLAQFQITLRRVMPDQPQYVVMTHTGGRR